MTRKSSDQLLGSVTRIIRPANGPADRNARRTSGKHLIDVRMIDAADREPRQLNLGRDLSHKVESSKFIKRLRSRFENRTDANATGSVEDGVASLLD